MIQSISLGTGEKGDGPLGEPLKCQLNRPHGIFVDQDGTVFIGDSENHRVLGAGLNSTSEFASFTHLSRLGRTVSYLLLACMLWLIPVAIFAATGDVDFNYSPRANGQVFATAVQPDGRILIGGDFTGDVGVARKFVARLNSDGTVDSSFNIGANGSVRCVAVLADEKILVGGDFTTMGGVKRGHLARLNADSTLDTGFGAEANGVVNCLAIQIDGKVLVGGNFTDLGGLSHSGLARLNADGTLDTSFNPGVSGEVASTAFPGDGKIVIAGSFVKVGDVPRNRVARLNSDGSLDSAFNPDADGRVNCAVALTDGKILLGGWFTTVGGVMRNRLARLNPDGTLDLDFNPDANSLVSSVAAQADGNLVVGGLFTKIGGAAHNRLAQLLPEGTPDARFNAAADTHVLGVALQADGRILLGGEFIRVNGETHYYLARLENDGATQSLTIPSTSRAQWLRDGSSPESQQVAFDLSTDGGATYSLLGAGTRIIGGWELTGLNLPGRGHLRARARMSSGYYNGSSSLVETVTYFSLVNPAPQITPQSVTWLGNGALQFTFANPDDQPWTVFGTIDPNLPTAGWSVLGTSETIGGGVHQFVDVSASGLARRFYQLRRP